jgi:hypothetical protein
LFAQILRAWSGSFVGAATGWVQQDRTTSKQRAAWDFMNFAASQRGFTIITSVIGYLPLRDDVLDDERYLKPFIDKDPRMLPTIKQLPTLTPKAIWAATTPCRPCKSSCRHWRRSSTAARTPKRRWMRRLLA